MATTYDSPASLVGKTFDCNFGAFVPRLTVLSPTALRVEALIDGCEIDEVVKSDLVGLRPGLFVMNWTEQSGNFVVQVQDHENGRVHNYARLAGGQQFCTEGGIDPVPVRAPREARP